MGRAGGCTRRGLRKSVNPRQTSTFAARHRRDTKLHATQRRRPCAGYSRGASFHAGERAFNIGMSRRGTVDSHSGMDMFDTMTSRSVRTTAAHHSTQR